MTQPKTLILLTVTADIQPIATTSIIRIQRRKASSDRSSMYIHPASYFRRWSEYDGLARPISPLAQFAFSICLPASTGRAGRQVEPISVCRAWPAGRPKTIGYKFPTNTCPLDQCPWLILLPARFTMYSYSFQPTY